LEFLASEFSRIVLSDNVVMTIFVAPFLFVAERFCAARAVAPEHYRFGMLFFAANAVLLGVLAPTINYWTAVGVQALGYGLIDLSALGVGGLAGSLIAVLVSTFVLDFFYYWFHRALHRSEVLWQMHLLHHSDENMNVMTAQRGHIFEGLMAPFFITFPMAVLFKMPAIEIAILSLLPQAYHFVSHANVRLNYGPFWWLIISPDYHRVHHSIEPRHRDKNFTNWFPIWDILFGTLYRPGKNERPETGVEGTRVETLWQAYILPIRGWRAMARAARGARPGARGGPTLPGPDTPAAA
jgi:sterol desaturase/sphingolipid hydroxylase (fatty acid hydroxylase superfamily)